MLEAMRVPVVGMAGYEADDIIATLASAGAQRDLDVLICSSDKDCRQLIGDRVKLYSLRKREVMDRDGLWKDWGVRPDQVVDLQTLVGDSVDNVPGVLGVGVKTAAKLLQEFGTLDNLLANLDQVAGVKTRANIRAAVANFPLSNRLVRLDTAVPLELDWDAWRLQEPDHARLLVLFQEWGFRRFADEMRTVLRERGSGTRDQELETFKQGELFPAEESFPFGANVSTGDGTTASPPLPDRWQATYHLVDTPT